jgi:hypothetical protein
MARPRRIKEPVKLNLLLEKSHKELALRLAADRGTSVSQLFVYWLVQDLDGKIPTGEPKDNSSEIL